jgi:hypothetical protein
MNLMKRILPAMFALATTIASHALARQSPAPTTRPALAMPCQFADDHIAIDLTPGANDSAAFTGAISVGGYRSARRFPLQGRFEGKVARGQFTDDLGDTYPFTAQLDGLLHLIFRTGHTTYDLSRVRGGIGVNLQHVDNGFRVIELIKDMPAMTAGLRRDDVITAVDDKAAFGEDASLIGLIGDVGTTVRVTVTHSDGTTARFTLTRAPLEGRLGPAPPAAEDTGDRGDNPRDR